MKQKRFTEKRIVGPAFHERDYHLDIRGVASYI